MNGVDTMRWVLNGFELIAVLAGLWHWHKIKPTYWRWLLLYLIIILCNELLGKYLNYVHQSKVNQVLYRYVAPLRFAMLFWVLVQPFGAFAKQRMWLAISLYALAFLIEEWLLPTAYKKGNVASLMVACVMILWFSLAFLSKLLQSNAVLNFKKNMHFWLSVGLLLFYIVFMPFHTSRLALNQYYPDVFLVYWYVQMIAACAMYVCFTILFIWAKPN